MSNELKIRELLTPEQIRDLTQRSNYQGAWLVCRTWALIAGVIALVIFYPNPVTWFVAIVILGGQQLALAIATHEAAHRSLFKTRWLNTVLADWLCARPVWLDVERYRQHHMRHHRHTGTDLDPDMSLVAPFPGTRAALIRKLFRDVGGLTGLRRIVGLVLMDIGVLKYTVAAEVERLPKPPRGWLAHLQSGIKNFGPVLISNVVLAVLLAATGNLWAYSLWLIAYLSSFSLFLRIRSIAEHAVMPGGADILRNTRTTRAGWLARQTVAPLNVNYHQEHHLLASVPFFNLPKLHALLQQAAVIEQPPSYAQVMKKAASTAA